MCARTLNLIQIKKRQVVGMGPGTKNAIGSRERETPVSRLDAIPVPARLTRVALPEPATNAAATPGCRRRPEIDIEDGAAGSDLSARQFYELVLDRLVVRCRASL